MQNIKVSEIIIYPIKSFGGISLNSSKILKTGLEHDRLFMLVDENNNFITQRQFPILSTIKTEIDKDGIIISNKAFGEIIVPFIQKEENYIEVNVWRSICKSLVVDENINKILSNFLNIPCKLVYLPEETKRTVNPEYDILGNSIVSFADGYPFLIISQESLDDLNSKLEQKILMNRFRPNIVVSGGIPFQEDTWKKINIGDNIFHIVKPCERCVITTVEQDLGISLNKEPLKTLSTYRNINGKIIFGQNMISENFSSIKIYDSVNIIL